MDLGKHKFRVFSSVSLYVFKLMDLIFIYIAGVLSYAWQNLFFFQDYFEISESHLVISLLLFFVISREIGLYRPWRGRSMWEELFLLLGVNLFVVIAFTIIATLLQMQFLTDSSIFWISSWFLITLLSQGLLRIIVRQFLGFLRERGLNQRRIALVGTHKTALDVVTNIASHPEYGIEIIGYFDDRKVVRDDRELSLKNVGQIRNIQNKVEELNIDQLWITFPMNGENRAKQIVEALSHSTVSIRLVVDLDMVKQNDKSITDFGGVPLLDIDVSPLEGSMSRIIKNFEDRLFACLALVLLSPLFILIAIGVKLSSPGPVFYRQIRLSWNNKPFHILKFRSMPIDAEVVTGAIWAKSGEKRATAFGAFLRKTSLDELPQFINVIRGDMSIVGPRPERPELIEQFKETIPDYMKKHMVKAGITGWAQVNGYRGDTDLNKRLEYDLYYIKNWSLFFDILIALQTVYKGFVHKNAY